MKQSFTMGLHEGGNGSMLPLKNQIFIVIIAIAVVIRLVIAPSIVSAQTSSGTVEGTPHLSTSAPNAQFSPGESGVLSVSVMNNATYDDNNETHPQEAYDRAGEAEAVWLNVSDVRDAPLTVETGD